VTHRVIVIDHVDTHFRTINETRNVETFAFSSPSLAIASGRVLRPDLFVVGDADRGFDADGFTGELRAHEELRDVPVLVLTPGANADVTEGSAGDRLCRRIDPCDLGARLKELLDIESVRAFDPQLAAEQRRAEHSARHCDSLSRIALMNTVADDAFIAAVLRDLVGNVWVCGDRHSSADEAQLCAKTEFERWIEIGRIKAGRRRVN